MQRCHSCELFDDATRHRRYVVEEVRRISEDVTAAKQRRKFAILPPDITAAKPNDASSDEEIDKIVERVRKESRQNLPPFDVASGGDVEPARSEHGKKSIVDMDEAVINTMFRRLSTKHIDRRRRLKCLVRGRYRNSPEGDYIASPHRNMHAAIDVEPGDISDNPVCDTVSSLSDEDLVSFG